MDKESIQDIEFGDRRLVGQHLAREHLQRILTSGRISHAYLFSGPRGVGKTAFSLAFAEIINGVDNLTDLKGGAESKKSSWFTHPDIHLFLPVPTSVTSDELLTRLQLLKEDPYEIVDFSIRPTISSEESSKNLQAFYPIRYFREEIRPLAFLKPNEGNRTVIILTNVEKMRAEAANAFLKLLEEPSDNVMFILTTHNTESLLPTILSRCHHIQLTPIKTPMIEKALVEQDGIPEEEAKYLARLSGGNYAMTRFYDVDTLKSTREEIINYLRYSYSLDAVNVTRQAQEWQSDRNIEGQIAILNVLEVFLRDLMVYRSTGKKELITNADQLNVIRKFCDTLQDANLEGMVEEVLRVKPMIYQNVQAKLVFTVLSQRFSSLMRGKQPVIAKDEAWKHLPAYSN